ncbi:MAG TPA: hypothetical protein VLA54_09195 [Acidimicrobiia bacterium]|nr:hypothetical protein [Acidimicrobiia bacterium]
MALAVSLFAVLLIIAALVVWQHSRRDLPNEVTYGIVDAVEYVEAHLPDEVLARLGPAGIRRIIEWEVYYLQGLAQPDRRHSVVTVAGDYPPAVEFITGEIASRHGLTYSAADVSAVLLVEVGYLQSIGAIGGEIGGVTE